VKLSEPVVHGPPMAPPGATSFRLTGPSRRLKRRHEEEEY